MVIPDFRKRKPLASDVSNEYKATVMRLGSVTYLQLPLPTLCAYSVRVSEIESAAFFAMPL
jgi:hypothetical protein